ncbi:MAG: TetR/AcrR family transcriptional regulator [Proteobacteria bacterium]|nr:TetR/AcrR family transcriptional regulator [Pseudomonadota bacterium]
MTTLKDLKEKEKEARKNLIITAAQELFAESDFRKVTAREIARKAGVSPGTIYRYYKNMDDLFVDIFLIHVTEISRLIDLEFENNHSCSVLRFCEIQVEYLNEHMAFYQMMSHFMLAGSLPSETATRLNPILRKLLDLLETALVESGITDDVRLHAHALFSSLNGTMISYARYPGRDLAEIKQHTMTLARIIAARFSHS